jgi:hypothetical protein
VANAAAASTVRTALPRNEGFSVGFSLRASFVFMGSPYVVERACRSAREFPDKASAYGAIFEGQFQRKNYFSLSRA